MRPRATCSREAARRWLADPLRFGRHPSPPFHSSLHSSHRKRPTRGEPNGPRPPTQRRGRRGLSNNMTGLSCSGKFCQSLVPNRFRPQSGGAPANNPHEFVFRTVTHRGPEKEGQRHAETRHSVARQCPAGPQARYEVGRRYRFGWRRRLSAAHRHRLESTGAPVARALQANRSHDRRCAALRTGAPRCRSRWQRRRAEEVDIGAGETRSVARSHERRSAETTRWLDAAAAAGDAGARATAHALQNCPLNAAADVLDALKAAPGIDLARLVPLA